jgi:hypothetical protein
MTTTDYSLRVLIGWVGVDSGQLMVCDPSYITGDFASDEFQPDKPNEDDNYPFTYNGACGATLSDERAGQLGIASAVAFSSGLGDGVYPVYATIVDDEFWGKRIAKVEIVMMDTESDEI